MESNLSMAKSQHGNGVELSHSIQLWHPEKPHFKQAWSNPEARWSRKARCLSLMWMLLVGVGLS